MVRRFGLGVLSVRLGGTLSRMARRFTVVLLSVLTVAGLLWPLVDSLAPGGVSTTGPDPVTVTSYDVAYDLATDGRLVATETLTASFPSDRHGIFRYWDVSDRNDPGVRYEPQIDSITRDGAPEPFEMSWDGGRRYRVAKIGDPYVLLSPGSHVYRIAYAVDGAISPLTAGRGSYASFLGADPGTGSAFVWNVVAQGWLMDMNQVRVTVHLPASARGAQCTLLIGAGDPCEITGVGTSTIVLAATDVLARSGMSARITTDVPTPQREHLPWPVTWDQILGTSLPGAVGVAVVTVLAFAFGLVLARRTREPEPGLPVMYEPPAGLGPVQTVYIDREDVGDHALVSTLLHLAERGVVTLDHRSDDTWLVTGTGTPEQWAALDWVSRSVGETLRLMAVGSSFVADEQESTGQWLNRAAHVLSDRASRWAARDGLMRSVGAESWAKAGWFLVLVLAVVGFSTVLGPSMYGLPLAASAIAGAGLASAGVGRRRTAAGRQVWSQAGGFERLLSTTSAEDRFDFAARQDLFLAYIPYAVAFGVADRWAEKYRIATGQEPPTPVWYPATGASGDWYSSGGGFDSFDSALAASISAYSASESSSGGGGGGGGFSGGGGGGGGGGSW